ncbi:hypothetical protein MUY14_12755 [Amycolatopsis sp. FBCC-B4732]|uniref:hypothetical protein n=1 Tax=Amycolatopsis sp. FBCC-B4732 TaxID=3079339 RepID=UPI001FF437E7|nr:hypothetical protein [Amycolatopsis sp. FBCC-B4732]UOX91446.1 hypothetical protein MUY14_12755 [Amycolatopsis sp. FBCC-B4732]
MIIGEAGQAAQALWGDVFDTPGRVYGGGGGGGGQFQLDPEELKSLIGQWEDVLDKIVEDGSRIREIVLAGELAPGQDPASGSYATTTGDSVLALQRQNDSMRKYAQEYIKKLKEAQSKTVVTDQSLSETFKA